jgi:hypothetical protein
MPPVVAQETLTPAYAVPEKGTFRYKLVETTDAYTQVQNGLDADINRKTESYFAITGLAPSGGNVCFELVQDTVFVEDKSKTQVDNAASLAFVNMYTRKPIRFTVTPQGGLVSANALQAFKRPAGIPSSVSDNYLARQAMFLPMLPSRTVKTGDTWTETHSDTLNQSATTSDIDLSDNITFATSTITWTIDGWETISSRRCLKISCKTVVFTETRRVSGRNEVFSEENTTVNSSIYVEPATGLLVKSIVKSTMASKYAMFGGEPSIRQSTINVEKNTTLLPS